MSGATGYRDFAHRTGCCRPEPGPGRLHEASVAGLDTRLCDRAMPSDPLLLRDAWRDVPHRTRLSEHNLHRAEILMRHGTALDAGLPVYADPRSGLSVFTSEFLARRGYCCDSGCRHCPFIAD